MDASASINSADPTQNLAVENSPVSVSLSSVLLRDVPMLRHLLPLVRPMLSSHGYALFKLTVLLLLLLTSLFSVIRSFPTLLHTQAPPLLLVEGHTAQTVDYHTGQPCNKRDPNAVFLDATTANMLLTIHDNLSKG